MRASFAAAATLAALVFTGPDLLAQAKERLDAQDFLVEVDLTRTPVLAQGRTGTCWSYATTSFLESEIARLHGEEVDLSEMFTVYWTYLEKARRYARLHGRAQFSQGGLSHDVIAIAKRYGVAPADAYTGLLGDSKRHDHSKLEDALKELLEPFAKGRRPMTELEDAVRAVLDEHLGPVPATVEGKGATATPRALANDLLQLPLDDYVEVMSIQSEGFGHRGELLVPDNWMHFQGYWNVPIDELLANVDHALKSGYTIALDCDVSERTNGDGLMKLSDELEVGDITDELRQEMFDTRKTTDDHLMQIVGIAKGPGGGTWYVVKNSWGTSNPFGGNVMMSRAYLAAKTLAIMVHRDGLLDATRATFEAGVR